MNNKTTQDFTLKIEEKHFSNEEAPDKVLSF
jgi:hypothetical protein